MVLPAIKSVNMGLGIRAPAGGEKGCTEGVHAHPHVLLSSIYFNMPFPMAIISPEVTRAEIMNQDFCTRS